MTSIFKVFIAGAGRIGRATGLLLRELGDLNVDLCLGDLHGNYAEEAAAWIQSGSSKKGAIETAIMPDEGITPELSKILSGMDLILDCLPGSQAPRLAAWAREFGLHYANLTEYVNETMKVREIAEGANTGFVVQTGLAPGFINVLGHDLYNQYQEINPNSKADSLSLRVGALTKHANPPHYYGFTWSPIGVATEYVKPSVVVRDFEIKLLPSLSERALVYLDGQPLEEDLTSGGVADLPEFFQGKIRNIDYKTYRFPGHYAWVDRIVMEKKHNHNLIHELEQEMLRTIPMVNHDDQVIIYAAVKGPDGRGHSVMIDKAFRVLPCMVGAQRVSAIQGTTAAGLAESARILLRSGIKGAVLQSDLNTQDFLGGPYVQHVYYGKR